jgi:hypothetical protein
MDDLDDVIDEALHYASDLVQSMPENGLVTDDGRIVEPNLDLIWRAVSQRHRELEVKEGTKKA